MAYVYILKSLKNGRYYIGCTANIQQRFLTHKSGGVKATRNILPLEIVFQQEFSDLSIARKVESKLKKLKRKDYIDKIITEGIIRTVGD